MLTVHYLEGSRAHRIVWLLQELRIPYELTTYARDTKTSLAPASLKKIHPLGKSPVITDGGLVIAESGAIIEYLVEQYGHNWVGDEGCNLEPTKGTPEHRQCRFWMHYAEGSLMNWLVMGLVFRRIPTQPMPFFVKPIAKALCEKVIEQLIAPNLQSAQDFIEQHLAQHTWFAGEHLSMADFQMGFAVEALLTAGAPAAQYPHLHAYLSRIQARPAYQGAIAQAGPVLPPIPQ